MRWLINIDREEGREGLDWARSFLSRFDVSKVQWLRIDTGRGRYKGVYGRCWLPTREKPLYRLSCQVPGPFPAEIITRRPPLYRGADGSWPSLPAGCKAGAYCQATKQGVTRYWIRVTSLTVVHNLSEAIIWIVSHEGFHFLRRERQVPGRNTEIEADRFADEQLALYREARRGIAEQIFC